MILTPVDVHHTKFKTAFKGYDRKQVDEFVKRVVESLEQLIVDKNQLQRKADVLQDDLERIRKVETAMTSALTLAQQSADEIKANAHKQAEIIISEAEKGKLQVMLDAQKQIDKLRTEIAMLEGTRDRFESEFRAVLGGYLEWLDKRKHNEDTEAEVA